MRKPNLFLVGAAKSGTTSMERYLSEHPQIFMSPRSEVHHFGQDLTIKFRVADRNEYLELFTGAGDAVAIGEKSIGYLFSQTAASEIYRYNPDSHIVIMLRNPVDMVFSLHRQFVRSGNEDLIDFTDALAAQSDRLHGRRLPPTCHKPDLLQYFEVVRYAPQVERYLNVFGARVVVVLFDDLKADPSAAYGRIVDLVGADQDFQPRFDVHNPTIDLPSVAIRGQMARFPGVASMGRRLVSPRARRRLRRASAVFQPQPDRVLDSAIRAELLHRFEKDIDQLSQLIDRDLSAWNQ
jgi:hypothetical protein